MAMGTGKRLWRKAFLLIGALVLVAAGDTAQARSPLPYFRGVETIAVFCRLPYDRDLRAELCAAAQSVLEDGVGAPVAVSARGFSDPTILTVLVNGHEVDGPAGPMLAITVRLLRKDHVDTRLSGPAPILIRAEDVVTPSLRLTDRLKTVLTETVIDPWRVAMPGRAGKDG